jgi:hypothetical protein
MALTQADLNQINQIVIKAVAGTATKTDLEGMATKSDLDVMATKTDLDRFATKTDLDRFATKTDLDRFATKNDLDRMEGRLITAINLLQRDTFSRLDQHEARIERLEKSLP